MPDCKRMVVRFVVCAAKTIVTGRSWFHSGMEMTLVGAIEAVFRMCRERC
jgi:hypothetical protein